MLELFEGLNALWAPFVDYLFLRRALLGCFVLSMAAGPLGVFLLLKRMTLIGDALSHGLLPGIAIAFICCGPSMVWMSVGGMIAGLSLATIAGLASRHAFLTQDAAFSGFYIFSMALGVMLLSTYGEHVHLLHILFGSILSISKGSLLFMTVVSSFTVMFLCVFYRQLLLECFDLIFFRSIGGNVLWIRIGFLCFLTLTLVTAFQALGTFMALGLLILPALIMRLLSQTFWVLCCGSAAIGFIASSLGLLASYHTQWASGPTIIVALGLCYCVVLCYSSIRRYLWVGAFLIAAPFAEAKPLSIVTTFTILKDLTQHIGGEEVVVHTLVGPDSDVHHYHPTPSSAERLAHCDLVILNGLQLEPWIDRLLESVGYKGEILVATKGIQPLFVEKGIPDPHAWHDVRLIYTYVKNITQALCCLRPTKKEYFEERAASYQNRLEKLDRWIRREIERLPHPVIVTAHQAFSYYGAAYGVTILSLTGLSTETEISAKTMKELMKNIRRQRAAALFLENMHNPAAMQMIAEETDIPVAGVLYSDSLSLPDGPASTYEKMMRANTKALVRGLKK